MPRAQNPSLPGPNSFWFVLAENISLGGFDKPVAVIAPNKIIKPLRDGIELVFAIRGVDCVDGVI